MVEGETEDYYFKNICQEMKLTNVDIKRAKKEATDPTSIFNSAIQFADQVADEEKKKGLSYTHVFLIFDLDVCTPEILLEINQYSKKQEKWHAFVSYPCIELWFMLHFKYSAAPFFRSHKTVNEQAKEQLRALGMSDQDKHKKPYTWLKKNKKADAYQNAKQLLEAQINNKSTNPITNVHELVYFLENLRSFKTKDAENSFTFINL